MSFQPECGVWKDSIICRHHAYAAAQAIILKKGLQCMYSTERQTSVGYMEHALQHRERVGVQDFVLLEDFNSEAAFVDNLRKRFSENLIYTYIGNVLISVNPYKDLPIYTDEKIKSYYRKNFFEAPPHVYAIADNAYRSLVYEHREQCILISGESGSGKTEASKKVLEYIAARTGHLRNVETVKDKLLQTNPLLEAFGNAKTNRNDNSSRFGKYMDVQFNYEGGPEGGHILNYLLEKSRVVSQMPGERNFHIFYQLLASNDEELLKNLHLQNRPDAYKYTNDTNKLKDMSVSDLEQYRAVVDAMKVIEISSEEQAEIFQLVASVLHLGNVKFVSNDKGNAEILFHDASSNAVAELLKVGVSGLRDAMTQRTIEARGDVVRTPLDMEQAQYARDALAKATYDRLFTWLVSRLNASLAPADQRHKDSVIGILDIYGFEIFQKNSFEQFCINFCNEKLQQLFVELTLKSEQEEYLREGIEWEPVQYFNNLVICDLIEARHKGIISILDEECLRPGDASDASFLAKMNQLLERHPHYVSHRKADVKTQKVMGRDEFSLIHYAGEVTYNVNTFLEKNNDPLFRDIRDLMAVSGNGIAAKCFPPLDKNVKRRPDTAITQFKNSLNDLIKILSGKEPSYIRCIKPNESKRPALFEDKLVTHQVKYLGLMENLRVRRAGFAYRRTYEAFLERYKCLAPATWPNYRGSAKDGVQELVKVLNYEKDDYRMGNTKIFIRFPKTLFETEDAFQQKKHDIATFLQSRWKGYVQRKRYQKMRQAAIIIQKWVRRFLAQKERERRQWAVNVIRAFIKGFITRNGPETPENRRFLSIAKVHWLKRLSTRLPSRLLDLSWPKSPATCQEASKMLHKLHRLHLSRKYRLALSLEAKRQLDLKVLAESMFKGKKNSYQASIAEPFSNDQLSSEYQTLRNSFMASPVYASGEKLIYSCAVVKYDRRGYKPRERVLLVSDRALYVLDPSGKKSLKLKHRLPIDKLEVVITNETDNLILVKIPPELKKDKGDLILSVPNLIEALTFVTDNTKKRELIKVVDTGSIVHNLVSGKQGGLIEVTRGPQPTIHRAKSGNLLVVATP